jgi:hypothetical protein
MEPINAVLKALYNAMAWAAGLLMQCAALIAMCARPKRAVVSPTVAILETLAAATIAVAVQTEKHAAKVEAVRLSAAHLKTTC